MTDKEPIFTMVVRRKSDDTEVVITDDNLGKELMRLILLTSDFEEPPPEVPESQARMFLAGWVCEILKSCGLKNATDAIGGSAKIMHDTIMASKQQPKTVQ